MGFAIFPLHLSKVLRLPRKSDARSHKVLHPSRKIILANLEIWCSKRQPVSGNQSPDLLTSLMNVSLVLRLPRKMHLCRSSSHLPCLPTFLKLLQNPHVLLTFDKAHNPLCLPRKTTSERPKVLRAHQFFYTFDFEMCFAPQQHGLFRHLNLQKRSEGGVFLAFSLANVLRATTACNISISHLARWLRTRRFSEPTFRPATNHWKNTVNRKFSTFSRTPASSFFWLFLYSDLLSSLLFSDSYHLCFSICPYCRKFDFF